MLRFIRSFRKRSGEFRGDPRGESWGDIFGDVPGDLDLIWMIGSLLTVCSSHLSPGLSSTMLSVLASLMVVNSVAWLLQLLCTNGLLRLTLKPDRSCPPLNEPPGQVDEEASETGITHPLWTRLKPTAASSRQERSEKEHAKKLDGSRSDPLLCLKTALSHSHGQWAHVLVLCDPSPAGPGFCLHNC
ncbi:hypothetical protein DPEC_G00056940 [Dallia pectoralis]|uniref:Uncharacterized protein n=1 Tax=Dallia pectoralis TaxID=75939 RepID=A0ACC2H6E3_DALPE|nr:hypothetical protein DPEC_G00056940 [Dallia pectoralis]